MLNHTDEIQKMTRRTKRHIDKTIDLVEKYENDPENKLREKEQKCRVCYYENYLAGQAFTKYKCIFCKEEYNHHNTHVPRLCMKCAKKYNICVQCGAEINVKP